MPAPPAKARSRRHRRPLVEELIEAARAGDRARFDRLFDLWFDAVLAGTHRSLKDRTLAHARTGELLRRALATRLAPTAGGEAGACGERAPLPEPLRSERA
jgi:hypothetical protein